MIIKNINIISFGKLKGKRINFSNGLNIIYGGNESGKTTIASFIEAMLYSFPPRSDRSRYLPWDNSTAAGEMTVNIDGTDKKFYRKFGQTPKGDILEPCDFSLSGHIPPTREDYRKSIYSAEGNAGGFGTTENIEIRITNMLKSGDESIAVSQAIKCLEKFKRSLNSGGKLKDIKNKISHLEDEYASSLEEEIYLGKINAQISEKKADLDSLNLKVQNFEQNSSFYDYLAELDQNISRQTEYISQFPSKDEPPQKPRLINLSLMFYILCSMTFFISSIFTGFLVFICGFIPITVYLLTYFVRLFMYKSSMDDFLKSKQCSNIEDYQKMTHDLDEAVEYYHCLLKQKSDAVTKESSKNAEKESLYKKILLLKNEIEKLNDQSHRIYREPFLIQEELDYYKNLNDALSKKISAAEQAINGFNYAKDVISTDFTPRVTKTAMEYIERIAPKDGREISLLSNMSLAVSDPVRQSLSSFSFGFREEVYLCFRIAWSEFLYGKDFPVIIDDPFLGSDDFRKKSITDLLLSISENRQVIVFTNRQNDYFNQLKCNWVDITPLNDV